MWEDSKQTPKLDATHLTGTLWIGGRPECGRLVREAGFDLLVLCAEEYQPPAWAFHGVDVHHAPFGDKCDLTTGEEFIVNRAVGRVVDSLKRREKVLVTCWAGHNRPGIVCAKTLVSLGWVPKQAVCLIQRKRDRALNNQAFVAKICGA
jgi:hypothetical protein